MLLDTGQYVGTTRGQPIYVATGETCSLAADVACRLQSLCRAGVTLTIEGVPVTNAAVASFLPDSTDAYTEWFPMFALQLNASLVLQDTVVHFNPADDKQVRSELAHSPPA